jgi:hypothetical protein
MHGFANPKPNLSLKLSIMHPLKDKPPRKRKQKRYDDDYHLCFSSSILVSPVPFAQVLQRPQVSFPSKTWFFFILFEFSAAEIT